MTNLNVVYSIDARLGGSGIGYIAYQALRGIYNSGMLKHLLTSSNAQTEIPRTLVREWGMLGRGLKYLGAKDSSGLIYHYESMLFDAWVAAQFNEGDIFHGWNGACLRTLRKAKRLGTITVVERASSHPTTQFQLLREEYQRWDVPLRLPMWHYERLIDELQEADYITVPSPFVRDSMIEAGIPERKLIEIPFGVDLDKFFPASAPSAHPFRVIFAGQVSIRKGVPYLLEAWRTLAWPDAELWIVGALTPDYKVLQQRWANVRAVHFMDHSAELVRLFQQSDIFVFPSIEEGSALVTYEAMACGLPVITTPNAGSVVRDGQDGFIVPIRDVTILCDRMQRLRDHSALRIQMRESAQHQVKHFTWSSYAEQLVTQYQRIQQAGHPT